MRRYFTINRASFEREDLVVVNSRGHRLQCSHFKPRSELPLPPMPCVVYCHGNCGSRCKALIPLCFFISPPPSFHILLQAMRWMRWSCCCPTAYLSSPSTSAAAGTATVKRYHWASTRNSTWNVSLSTCVAAPAYRPSEYGADQWAQRPQCCTATPTPPSPASSLTAPSPHLNT
jgi:hypothetical protein